MSVRIKWMWKLKLLKFLKKEYILYVSMYFYILLTDYLSHTETICLKNQFFWKQKLGFREVALCEFNVWRLRRAVARAVWCVAVLQQSACIQTCKVSCSGWGVKLPPHVTETQRCWNLFCCRSRTSDLIWLGEQWFEVWVDNLVLQQWFGLSLVEPDQWSHPLRLETLRFRSGQNVPSKNHTPSGPTWATGVKDRTPANTCSPRIHRLQSKE